VVNSGAELGVFWDGQLVAAKRTGQAGHFQLQGEERLGASLTIGPSKENDFDISKCTIQWHRESADGSKHGRITGAHSITLTEVTQHSGCLT
jgi:hypothetical protein